MPITLTFRNPDGKRDELRLEDVELREAEAVRDGSPAVVALQRYICRRLAEECTVELAGLDDQDTLRRLITHWIEGMAETRGEIQVVPCHRPNSSESLHGPARDQTLRDALLARRRPLLLVYDDQLEARQRLADLAAELDQELYLWTRADGWDPLLPDSDDDTVDMLDRDPAIAVGEALQALENGSILAPTVIVFQDLLWDVDGERQVLATAIPSLWGRLRDREGLLILLMPSPDLPVSWTGMFETIRFRAGDSRTPLLDRFGQDLTARARDGEIAPIAGRETERRAVLHTLRQAPGSASAALLIGPAGTGKSAILDQIALDLLSPECDPRLSGLRLIAIDMASLVAGTAYRGDLENRISQLIDEAVENYRSVVLVIDEIHTLATTGGAAALEALKAPLARGRIHLIGATTPEDWAPVERQQPAFASRFRKVHINPPLLEESIQAMAMHVPVLQRHHADLTITEPDLRQIAQATTDYLASPAMPREAIKLLYDLAARAEASGFSHLPEELVFQAISETIGAPVGPLSPAERNSLRVLQDELGRTILGQPEAIELVSNAVIAHRVSRTRHKPTFLILVGPTGTGKTETVRAINRRLVPGQELIEYRMEEFRDRHTGARFLGAPPGYVGYEEGSGLVNQGRRTPYRVVLLDELEKAHPDVIMQLMNLLVTGRFRDPRGLEGDFRRWVFCATSNLLTDPEDLRLPRARLIERVQEGFAPLGVPREVIGRVGIVVPFRPFTEEVLARIAETRLEAFQQEVAEESGSRVEWQSDVPRHLAKIALRSDLGARNIDQNLDPLRHAWAASSLDPSLASRPLVIEVDPSGDGFQLIRG